MNPAFLDDMSWEMAEVYGAISDQILINLAHYFPYFNANNLPASSFAYQAGMLAQMGKVNADTAKIIRNGLADADSALNGVLEAAIIQSIQAVEPDLYKAARLGILKPPVTPILSANQTRAFQLYYKQAADKLNLVNTVMLESTQQAYQQAVSGIVAELAIPERMYGTQIALDTGAGEVATGVSAWNQAVKHSIDRLKGNGITGFIDHAGKHWSAEAYTAMDIRTTVFNVGRSAVWEVNQDFGNDLYLVSYHNGARPLCYPWQSKVISSTDHARTVVDLDGNEITVYAQSETSYGEPAGLFGINCKHYPTPFIPGVSTIHDHQQSPEANEKTYEESQKQRQLERTLREEKRDLAMLKAQGAPEETIKAQKARCERADERIEDFCLETGRARHRDREAVYTKRAFPSKDSYNPALFETKQRDMINSFYQNGGTQQGYKFGEMNPKNPPPTQTPPPVVPATPAAQTSGFVPAQTRQQAEAYARERFAESVDFKGMSLENANKVNETLTRLQEKYPTNRLEVLSQKPQGAIARANFERLEINGKKLGKILDEEEINFKLGQAFTKNEIHQIESRYVGKAKLPVDAELKIEKLRKKLQYKRWAVQSSYDDHISCVITHEYGHIIADQYFGMSNNQTANPHYLTNWGLRDMSMKWSLAYEKAIKTGDIYGLSEYGSRNAKEFFAESFVAHEMGEKLPDYVESLLVEVLTGGIM